MYDLATIQAMDNAETRRARALGLRPYVVKYDEIHPCKFPPFPFPFLGSYVPKRWRKTAEYFVDSSGFGSEGEPALTTQGFIKKLKVGFGYAIVSGGQFQVYVGEFEHVPLAKLPVEKEVRAIALLTKTIPFEIDTIRKEEVI